MSEELNKKLDYLKREEVKTMEKDIAKLRESESEKERGEIAEMKTGEETKIEKEGLERAKEAAKEREKMGAEAERKEEELKRLREERKKKEALLGKEATEKEELERDQLRAQLKAAQLKEEEERKKFLERVAAKSEGREEIPLTPPVPPTRISPPAVPAPPAPAPPPAVPAPPVVPPTPTPVPVAPPRFRKPPLIEKIKKIKKPRLPTPRIRGYFPKKLSIFEKIWIRIVVSLLLLAILATIFTFWYWYLVVREKPEGKIKEGVKKEEIIKKEVAPPLALIPTEASLTLEISASEELPELLSQILKNDLGEDVFTRVLIQDTKENKFLGLKEFFEIFQVQTPEGFYDNVVNDFTLLIFSSPTGNQLGFVAKTENPAVLRSIVESWEETLENNSSRLFTFLGKTASSTQAFQKYTYKEAVIHYLSFAKDNFGICWAVTNSYFLFTSSGQNIIKMIDKIKE